MTACDVSLNRRLPHQRSDPGWLLFHDACWGGCDGVTTDIRRENGKACRSGKGWDNSFDADTYRIENAVDFVLDEADYARESMAWM